MHPILFRIPLPHGPIKLWWILTGVIVLAAIFALLALRKRDTKGAAFPLLVAAGAGAAMFAFKGTEFSQPNLPIYSYGVMLGLSLVIGWYLTLGLADKVGLPKEVMANCYVVTAIAAIVGARLLYVATNLDEFSEAGVFSMKSVFALRRGGLVAYGGFLGGFMGSWLYLRANGVKLLPWADVVVPSLATGLLVTRVGCYLFGCDFGKRLSDTAPGFLKKLGTFPHWTDSMKEAGNGSPAYVRHWNQFPDMHAKMLETNASLPAHPTQIYESLVGLSLFALLMWRRKKQTFRGEIFLLFVFSYGFVRFLLELLRDDVERGEFGPSMGKHLLIPGALLLFAFAFAISYAKEMTNIVLRNVVLGAAFLLPVVVYFQMKPASFGTQTVTQYSTSQGIGLLTALFAAYFHKLLKERALENPVLAMDLGLGGATLAEDGPKRKKKRKQEEVKASDNDDEGYMRESESLEAAGADPEKEPNKDA